MFERQIHPFLYFLLLWGIQVPIGIVQSATFGPRAASWETLL